ncbi:MAG: hypothetical protein WC248_08670 [Candidatus Methanomethylophilaceae archaeon]
MNDSLNNFHCIITAMTIASDVHTLLDTVRIYADSVTMEIADRQNDPRSMCFWNIHNRVKVTEEILTFYEKSWGSEVFPEVDDEIEGELVERVITVTRDMFVDVVSMVEKASKDAISIYSKSGIGEASMEGRSHLYLRTIIETTADLGLINEVTFAEWDDILVMRNLAAHNNSISDRSKKYTIGNIVISMRPNRMMKGPLNTFVVLTDRIVTLFYSWIKILDDRF